MNAHYEGPSKTLELVKKAVIWYLIVASLVLAFILGLQHGLSLGRHSTSPGHLSLLLNERAV
jgi:hypothetical protein